VVSNSILITTVIAVAALAITLMTLVVKVLGDRISDLAGSLGGRMGSVESRMGSLDLRMNSVEGALRDLGERMTVLETDFRNR
jgi:hypothetical protein